MRSGKGIILNEETFSDQKVFYFDEVSATRPWSSTGTGLMKDKVRTSSVDSFDKTETFLRLYTI